MSKPKTNTQNLEARHDAGDEVLDYFDTAKARVNLDLPQWMIFSIDRVAGRNGVARQSQIKAWLADKIKEVV